MNSALLDAENRHASEKIDIKPKVFAFNNGFISELTLTGVPKADFYILYPFTRFKTLDDNGWLFSKWLFRNISQKAHPGDKIKNI